MVVRRGKLVDRKCKNCGETFKARQADVNRGWGLFCTKRCKAAYQERNTGQYRQYLNRRSSISNSECDCDYVHPFSQDAFNT